MTRSCQKWLSGLGSLAVVVGLAAPALGQELQLPPAPDDNPGTTKPEPPDPLGGHLLIGARASAVAPGGSFASGFGTGDVITWGAGFGGSLGIGLGPRAALEAEGQYAFFSASGGCAGCSGYSYNFGLSAVYHVVGGSAVDPWVSYGVGYRALHLETTPANADRLPGAAPSVDYKGIDFIRIAMGASFKPAPLFGFGPFVGLNVGTYPGRPGPETSGATYLFVELGLRATFDPMGASSARPAAAAPPATTARR